MAYTISRDGEVTGSAVTCAGGKFESSALEMKTLNHSGGFKSSV